MNTFLIIYIIGMPVGYFATREGLKLMDSTTNPTWTVGDRYFAMFCTLFSWVNVIAYLFVVLVQPNKNSNKEANW